MQPGSTLAALGAGGFSGGAVIAALARWALQTASEPRRAIPAPIAAGSCESTQQLPCDSCCPELNWGSVLAFLYGEALRLSADPGAGLVLLVLALLVAALRGIRAQLSVAGEPAPAGHARRDGGARRVRGIAAAIGR